MSQIFSTALWRASRVSCMAAGENVTLSLRTVVGEGFIWRFVDAKVFCCIVEAPPSMAKNMKEPSGEKENR